MNKTFSFTNQRVLDRLNEVKQLGVNPSKYISDLILDDLDNRRITLNDLAKLFLAFTTMEGINTQSTIQNSNIHNPNTLNNPDIIDKIQDILDFD